MTEKLLKAYFKNKYGFKVKATKGFYPKYYVLNYNYDSQGGYYSCIQSYDSYGDVLANKLFDSICDIIDEIKKSKDYREKLL